MAYSADTLNFWKGFMEGRCKIKRAPGRLLLRLISDGDNAVNLVFVFVKIIETKLELNI